MRLSVILILSILTAPSFGKLVQASWWQNGFFYVNANQLSADGELQFKLINQPVSFFNPDGCSMRWCSELLRLTFEPNQPVTISIRTKEQNTSLKVRSDDWKHLYDEKKSLTNEVSPGVWYYEYHFEPTKEEPSIQLWYRSFGGQSTVRTR